MPQKIKIPSEEKICIVTAYLAGKYGFNEAVQIAGVSRLILEDGYININQIKYGDETICKTITNI
jgi:hypothetical protein